MEKNSRDHQPDLPVTGPHLFLILVSGPRQRTFRQLQDFAAEIFNADPDVSTVYTGDSWTKEFMEYGCYCNKAMRGGGKPDPLNPDVHENLCLGEITQFLSE